MSDWDLARETGSRQHGVLAPWQLRLAGVDTPTLQREGLRRGFLSGAFGTVVLRGEMTDIRRLTQAVLAYSGPRTGAARVAMLEEAGLDRVAAMVRAGLRAGQTVTGPSAAWMHGLGPFSAEHWLRLPGRTGHLKRPGIQLRYGPPAAVVEKQGLAVAEIYQTIADTAAFMASDDSHDVNRLCRLVAKMHRLRLGNPDGLAAWLKDAGAIDGARILSVALQSLDRELVHSHDEHLARQLLSDVLTPYGLVLHPQPYEIKHHGLTIAEADLAVVELRYDIEVDGPHHDDPAQAAADVVRDTKLEAIRWTVDRFPTTLLHSRPLVVAARVDATVRRLLGSAAAGTEPFSRYPPQP